MIGSKEKCICRKCDGLRATCDGYCEKCYEKLRHFTKRHNQRAKKQGVFGRIKRQEWIDILEKNNFTCAHCHGEYRKGLQLDHIIPMSKGGLNLALNVQPLCRVCHEFKDYHLPRGRRQAWLLFRDEEEIYSTLITQMNRRIRRTKNLRVKRLILLEWFKDTYLMRLTVEQTSRIDELLGQFQVIAVHEHPKPLMSLGALSSLQKIYEEFPEKTQEKTCEAINVS